jgi:hypothetical protein
MSCYRILISIMNVHIEVLTRIRISIFAEDLYDEIKRTLSRSENGINLGAKVYSSAT